MELFILFIVVISVAISITLLIHKLSRKRIMKYVPIIVYAMLIIICSNFLSDSLNQVEFLKKVQAGVTRYDIQETAGVGEDEYSIQRDINNEMRTVSVYFMSSFILFIGIMVNLGTAVLIDLKHRRKNKKDKQSSKPVNIFKLPYEYGLKCRQWFIKKLKK